MKTKTSATTTLTVVVTFLLIFGMAARTPLDSDLFWHLRSGEETLRAGRPLLVDLFSHTRYGAAWINHSWLSQVGMALLNRAGGSLALGAGMALLATLSMALVYWQCQGPLALRTLALILGSVVASVVWVPRPQLVSLVLFALLGYLLYLYKWRGVDRLWLLPPVFVLWSNLHGGYSLGLLLLGAVLAGEGLNHLLALHGAQVLSWRQVGRLLAWTVLCGLAVLINPNGIDTWRIPFQTVNVGVLQQLISEWASPDFHDLLQQALLWLLFATFGAVALAGREIDGAELLPVIGFAYLALLARRNYGPFALVAVPVLVRYAALALQSWQVRLTGLPGDGGGVSGYVAGLLRASDQSAQPAIEPPRWQRVLNLGIAAFLGLVVLLKLYGVTHPALVGSYLEQQYPVRAAAWLQQNQAPGRLINEYNWGGYLLWALPADPVFVDGRTDLFGDEVIGDWMALVMAGEGWEDVMAAYPVDIVMLEPSRPLLARLAGSGWQQVYADEQAVIYARTTR